MDCVKVNLNIQIQLQNMIIVRNKGKYDEIFSNLEQHGGKITGRVAKEEMLKSKLPNKVLGTVSLGTDTSCLLICNFVQIWRLADYDQDGMLDNEEFALAMHLIKVITELDINETENDILFHQVKVDGYNLPEVLPDHLIPPSHKHVNGKLEVTVEEE